MTKGFFGGRVLSSEELEELRKPLKPKMVDEDIMGLNPGFPHNPHIPLEEDVNGVTVKAASIARLRNDTFDPYDFTKTRGLYQYSEPVLFQDYEESYFTNPYTNMIVEYLVNRIHGDGYHFEGPGANVVEEFFWEDNTRDKMILTTRDAVRFGTGLMDFGTAGERGRVIRTRVLDVPYYNIELDIDIESPTYGERTYYEGTKKLREDRMFHLFFRDVTGKAWPMSFLRPNIHFLAALQDMSGDVFAALKRVAYAPIVVSLDMAGIKTDTEKEKMVNNFIEYLKEVESASQNFVVDKRHEVQLLGVGSAGARLLPTNDLIEPIISVVLRSCGFPIGLFLQQGANRATVEAQREDVRVVFEHLRSMFKYQMEKKLLSKITNRNTKLVWNRPPPSTVETQEEMKALMTAFQLRLISREYFLDQFDIADEGKTLYEGPPQQGATHDISPKQGPKERNQ